MPIHLTAVTLQIPWFIILAACIIQLRHCRAWHAMAQLCGAAMLCVWTLADWAVLFIRMQTGEFFSQGFAQVWFILQICVIGLAMFLFAVGFLFAIKKPGREAGDVVPDD